MAVLGTEKMMDGVVSIKANGTAMGTSLLAESTWPCANIVIAQAWSALSASLWMSWCNAGEAASAFSNSTNAISKTDKAGLPDWLKKCFARCTVPAK